MIFITFHSHFEISLFLHLANLPLLLVYLPYLAFLNKVTCTNRILIFAGVTDIEQKKDETEKTEAETEKKTTDSKCFFVNFGLFIHFLYSNQSRRQFVYSANQNLTDVPRLPWPAAVTYCFFQVSFTSLLCGRNYWTCNTNPRALLHLKAEIWTYKHFPGLVLYSVGHQKSNRVHIFHISRIQAPVVDESSTQSLVITNSFRELIV